RERGTRGPSDRNPRMTRSIPHRISLVLSSRLPACPPVRPSVERTGPMCLDEVTRTATHDPGEAPGRPAVRPECGAPAYPGPPTALVRGGGHGMPPRGWSHADGEPLCPVLGPGGYQPATPA